MACWASARGLTPCEGADVLLDIPDIRQRDDFSCGAACVDAVARFHGLTPRGPVQWSNPVQGASPEMVAHAFRALGLSVLSGTMTVDDLRHLTRTNRPVLCPVNLFGGHWLVVRGVERNRVHYHCPLLGGQAIPTSLWLSQWRDVSEAGRHFDRWGICPICDAPSP